MENLSHSFLKRSYGGNGFGTASHKSVYDDVFGGPPKFGMPTLAPRLEDYSEIFGGFHSARGSSIPILDLPVVDEAELYFDVRSSRFDYSEVFGGSHGLDFALSLDDFLWKSNGRDDPSDDAWSPAESESSLYDTDPSAFSDRSQSFANEDTHYPLSGIRQFDTSYNKANQRSNGKILNLDTPVAQLHAIPGVSYMIDENHVSQKVEGQTLQTPSELKSNMGFDGGTAADKKTISLPRIFDFGRHERDCSPVEKYSGSGFLQNKPFITVNDINLQTKPSRLPPPSRPPPVYDVEKGASAKLNSKMKDARSCTFEQTEDDSSPAFYDLEIDGSSSMTASTAMRDVMEKAQAKIRSAKESIEKKEVLQTRLKLQPQSNTKTVEEKISNTVASISSRKDDRKVNCAEESSGTVPLTEERNKVIKMDEEVPDLVEQERFIDFVERTTKGRDSRETRLSYQVPLKSAQAFAWRQATEYFEVVDAGIPLKSVEQHKDETNLVHMGSDEFGNWVATEASDQKEEIKEFKAAKEAPELEEKNNKLKVTAEAWCDRIRSETASDSSCEIVFQKIAKVGLNSCEPDMDKKKIKIAKQHEEIKKLQNDSNKSAETQTKADMNVAEVDDNPRGINEKPGSNKMLNDAYTRKTKERKPKEALVMQESDTRLNEAIEQEKDGNREIMLDEKKKQEEYHEKRKNKKKQKEVCKRKENEDMLKEVIRHEYDGQRPRTATEHKQYEKNLKKSFEKEENKKSEELDGSATACVEEDIEASSTVISTSRKGINVTEEASKHQGLSGHPEDSGLIMRDGDDRTAKLNQVRYSTMERESIKAFDGTDKLNVESNSALSSEKLDKNFGKMETQATISCGEEEELKTELKESENGIDVRVGMLGDREIPLNTGKKSIRNVELKEKILNETIAQENTEIEERLQKERELEKEHLRKIEEEREREREREKDRMAVDRATLEARDRSRERATAELRQRAMAEAREKLEKSSLEARERSLADKASMEERIWAERAAVERVTLEARQRAFEKAMADRVSLEGRARVERSVSDKFYTSSTTDEMRQSSSFSDLPGLQSQNTGTLNPLRYSYSSVHVGIESESPQRSKARLERYRRTAERADKALAEKNLRDLVAQREQAERNRLAETLDADVKRWSSGKEGNLRALLSTLQYILGPDSGWQPIPLTEVITSAAVKKAYRKATLCVHPDKLQQRGASIQQKYLCEKVFDLLKEAWNTFNSEEW